MLAFLPPTFQHVSLDKICPVPFLRLKQVFNLSVKQIKSGTRLINQRYN